MKKLSHWLAFLLLILASCGKVDFGYLKVDQPYVGKYQDKTCVVVFDEANEGNLSGRVYLDNGTSEVDPIAITSVLGTTGKGILRIKGTEMKLKRVSLKKNRIQGHLNNKSFSFSLDEDANLQYKPLYKERCYGVAMEENRVFAKNVEGYWMSYPDTDENFGTIYIDKVSHLVSTKKLDLDMDVYYPNEPAIIPRPLLVLIHGGAFYNGDKQALGYPEMGHYFAERGYVVASINYRLGFKPLAGDVDRAGYRALQDAHAAVCHLIENADEFGIDTTMIFAAGTSAGAITALNLAFMREENRPETTKAGGVTGWILSASKKLIGLFDKGIGFFGNLFNQNWSINGDEICKQLGLDSDLGPINAVAGSLDRPFQIRAVVNMWGAVHDLAMLKNSPETSILSFHGDEDPIVPYGYGYPFDKVLDPYVDDIIDGLPNYMQGVALLMQSWVTKGKPINEWAFNPMQGSKAIHDKAYLIKKKNGEPMRSELHTLEGADSHSLHVVNGELSDYFYDTIIPAMTQFLYEEIVGGKTVRLVQKGTWFEAEDIDNVVELHWQVDGGAVIGHQGDNKAKIWFFSDAEEHSVSVCGRYKNGVEFRETWKER